MRNLLLGVTAIMLLAAMDCTPTDPPNVPTPVGEPQPIDSSVTAEPSPAAEPAVKLDRYTCDWPVAHKKNTIFEFQKTATGYKGFEKAQTGGTIIDVQLLEDIWEKNTPHWGGTFKDKEWNVEGSIVLHFDDGRLIGTVTMEDGFPHPIMMKPSPLKQ